MSISIAETVVATLFAAALLLNMLATRAILRDDSLPPTQSRAQIAFVWLVPLLGALLTLYLKRTESKAIPGGYPEETDTGDDSGFSSREYRHLSRALEAESGGSHADD